MDTHELTRSAGERFRTITRGDLLFWVAVINVEAVLLVGYFLLTAASITAPRYVIYPFVWINVAIWVARRVNPPAATPRHRRLAAAVAVTYFLLLSYLGGFIAVYPIEHGHVGGAVLGMLVEPAVTGVAGGVATAVLVPLHGAGTTAGIQVTLAAPGWGPRIAYVLPEVGHVYVVPYRTAGYLALAYLVYVTVLDAARAAVSGVLGVGACLGCSFPIVASLAAGVAGSSSLLVETVRVLSIDISTLVYLLAVGLLYWRPGSAD